MSLAIWCAKERGAEEVLSADVLEGCLRVVSRFGVAAIGSLQVDLEEFGIDWLRVPERGAAKVSYSDEVVHLLDRAAAIAKADGYKEMGIDHVLVAFGAEDSKALDEWKQRHGVTSPQWRAAVGVMREEPAAPADTEKVVSARGYLSPEEAAGELGIHVQTVRAYVRSGKLPAVRMAGERAIRIRREDLPKLMEPMQLEM